MADNINERLAREYTAGQIDTERAPEAPTLFTPTEDVSSIVRSIKALTSTVNQLMGRSGTAFDKAVSMRDLVASGVLALKIGGTVVASSPTPSTGGGSVVIPAEPDGPGYRDPRPVLLTPPVLTEVQAHGAFRNVIIIWKRVAYRNHAYVEVWRSLTNNLSTAARLGTTTADVYADATGTPNTTYYYWVRAVNIEGNIGPFHAVLGAAGTLAPLVDDEVPPQFIKRAMIALAAIDDALIANLSAAKVTFGEMSGDRISANTLHGDKITTNTLHGDKIIANTVTAAKINGYNLVVYSGTYTGYAWPATGNGFYLGPQGLLLGNANAGKYFQVEASGDLYAPGFSIVNGNATFSGALSAATGSFAGSLSAATGTFAGSLSAATGSFAGALSAATGTFSGALTASAVNAVNTINIAGEAVTVPRGAYTPGAATLGYSPVGGGDETPNTSAPVAQSVNITTHGQKVVVTFGCLAWSYSIYGLGGDPVPEYAVNFGLYRDNTLLMAWSHLSTGATCAMPPFTDNPPAGTYTYYVRLSTYTGSGAHASAGVLNRGMFAMEVQR